MKVKSVILDTTVSQIHNPALWTYNNLSLLDWQIDKIFKSGRRAIVVIGQDGDDLLRTSKRIDDCDLVFSSKSEVNSGLIAGLHGSGVCAFYLPIDIPYPHESVWLTLEKNLIQLPYTHKIDVIKPVNDTEGYPWLITNKGRDLLLESPEFPLHDLSSNEVHIYHQSIAKSIKDPKDLIKI